MHSFLFNRCPLDIVIVSHSASPSADGRWRGLLWENLFSSCTTSSPNYVPMLLQFLDAALVCFLVLPIQINGRFLSKKKMQHFLFIVLHLFSAEAGGNDNVILYRYVIILYVSFSFLCSRSVANWISIQSTCRVYQFLLFSGSKIHLFWTFTKI